MSTMLMPEIEVHAEDLDREEVTTAEAVARGRAAAKAGRVVPHSEVRAWLMSWGTANPVPRPRPKCR